MAESSRTSLVIQPTEHVGRFEVLRCIGVGGMGQVYAAYDPQLDRTIALKVLHEDHDRSQRPRLIREAQALARLSHPNVVTVHDVGVHQGRLFIAMEFVEGITLRDWLRRHPPGSAERRDVVLGYLLQAGEGLAAAHRAGLIHRDFKPSNVLIGDDGRVRVMDFGLVRVDRDGSRVGRDLGDSELGPCRSAGELLEVFGEGSITQPGMVVGTPAYMAPEQLLAMPVVPATDQFGFCATAWESLFGVRAFAEKSLPGMIGAMRSRVPRRPMEIECPAELEVALRKGLAFRMKRRHASIEVLLEILRAAMPGRVSEDCRLPRSRRPWVPGKVVLAGAFACVALVMGRREPGPCDDTEKKFAGIWDEAVKEQTQNAFTRVSTTEARAAWPRFEDGLDTYEQEWTRSFHDACGLGQAAGGQSTELMHLRMACLDARRQGVAALMERYAEPNAEMIAGVDEALAGLGPISACADSRWVQAMTGYREE